MMFTLPLIAKGPADSKKDQVIQAQERTKLLYQLVVSTLDLDNGIRGYLLTGLESYLAPFNRAETEFEERLKSLIELYGKDSKQAEELKKIGLLKVKWLDETAIKIMISKKKLMRGMISNEDFTNNFVNSKGKEQIEEIIASIGNLIRPEEAILEKLNKPTK